MDVVKVTLGTGKVVLLRQVLIKHQDLAAQAAAQKMGSNNNELALGVCMQKELLKLLIVQMNGQDIKPVQLEDLDSLFTFSEYIQLTKVLDKLLGDQNTLGNFQVEFASYGGT